MKKRKKLLAALAVLTFAGAGYALADGYSEPCCDPCPNAFMDTCGDDVGPAPLPKKLYGVDMDNYNVMFGTKGHETKKLTFFGLIQTDFDYVRTDDRSQLGSGDLKVNDPFESLHFIMRRVRLGVDADLGNCWSGVIVLDLGKCDCNATCSDSQSNRFYTLHMAYIQKVYAGNSFIAGYRKVNFGAEEVTPAAKLKTIERSVATNYFAGPLPCKAQDCCDDASVCSVTNPIIKGESRLGFSSRHVGLFVDGAFENFGYGLAVVNSFPGLGLSSQYANEIGLYGNLYYMGDFNGVGLVLGVNVGYQPEANTLWMTTADTYAQANSQCSSATIDPVRSSILGWNPYGYVYWQNLYILAEMLGARVEHGAINSQKDAANNAKPLGYNIVVAYMINDCWELVSRYSNLDTDQRGVRISHVVPSGNDVLGLAPAPLTSTFDEVDSFYFGFNYYIKNKSVKLAFGYEHLTFSGRWGNAAAIPPTANIAGDSFGGDKAKVDAVRARVQLVF